MARTAVLVIWHTGQSNAWGSNPGEAVVLPGVPYWDTFLGGGEGTPSTAFHSLHGDGGAGHTAHGSDATIGRLLAEAGYDVVIINLSRGSTFAYSWVPASPGISEGFVWPFWLTESAAAWAALKALKPNATFRHIHVRDQGQSDMRLATDGAWPSIVARWAEDTQKVHANLEALVGQSVPKVMVMSSVLFWQTADTSGPLANWRNEIRAQQELWCPATGPNGRRVYTDNGVTNLFAFESDNVHFTQQGYIDVATPIAQAIKELVPMGSLSSSAKDSLINHEMNKGAYTPAATHYMHLYAAGGVPISGNGYAVQSKTNNTTNWSTPSGRAVSNLTAWTFPTPTGSWSDVVEARITTSATEGAGVVLASDTFAPVPVNVGTGPFSIAIGAFVITAAAGGFVDTVVHRMLGLMFGATTYTADPTCHMSYYAGDPQGAGAQAGARTSITKATAFGTSSAGVMASAADIALPHQGTGTYVAFHTLTSGGVLLYSATRLGTIGLTGTLPAGQVRVQIP